MPEFFIIEPCSTANGYEIKLKDKNQRFDINKAETLLTKLGTVIGTTPVVVVGGIDKFSLSIYASGRIMIKSQKHISFKDAEDLAKRLLAEFEKNKVLL